jgi:polyribonucleotide nucleotidyltransferase
MAEAITVSGPVSGTDKTLTLSTGVFAPQSQGAVVAKLGNTQVLATANGAKEVREGTDFFPLTIDVEEKAYAAGKIPGSFFRKEGRPSDNAVLVCRLIDRPLRPSFPKGYRNETQVVITVQGADQVNPYDVVAINAASASLMLTGLPFEGPSARAPGLLPDGEWIPHPTYEEQDESTFQIVVAGREVNGEIAIMMVEASGTEKAWTYYENGAPKVTEEVIAGGLDACKVWIGESLALQNELVAKVGRKPALVWENQIDYSDEIEAAVKPPPPRPSWPRPTRSPTRPSATPPTTPSRPRSWPPSPVRAPRSRASPARSRAPSRSSPRPSSAAGRRRGHPHGRPRGHRPPPGQRPGGAHPHRPRHRPVPAGRDPGPQRAHPGPAQDGPDARHRRPGHQEALHAPLQHAALRQRRDRPHGWHQAPRGRPRHARRAGPAAPRPEPGGVALRPAPGVRGDASNGSTSMASVCSSSLSLMDGGVPIKAAVAGIAMGLIYEDGNYVTLTDILGSEDAFGDMDFKVAGTAEFVTALQLDTKIEGLPADVLGAALDQAKVARLQILEVMNAAIAEPRDSVGESAPKIISFEIPIDKIGEIIGPKGKVINAMQAETGADISVDDDGMVGTVSIGATDLGAVAEAERQIRLILNPPTAEVGQVYPGRVVNITKFGAFVNILPGRDGLVHISKMGGGKRIEKVEDVLELGQEIDVKVDDVDPNGKVSLTPVTPLVPGGGSGGAPAGGEGGGDAAPSGGSSSAGDAGRETVSFEDTFDAEIREEFGDLGPGADRGPGGGGGDRGGRGGERRGGSGGGRRGGGRR